MNLIVGTAGHIDHGKTSLVRALTGMDLDRLPEEQERGITITLGFAWLDLADGRRVAFVDVPGHEKLVATMVSGATGLDGALLCVSAVEGAMPQTREHLAILDLLGVRDGAVVLTMADLVDPELAELAAMEIRDLVAGTFLEGKPVVPFSAVTGLGKERLIEVLADFQSTTRSGAGPFRMPVDRRFVMEGFGVVTTGTVAQGEVAVGSTVRLEPGGREARIRGIEVHGETVQRATAGQRAALNLAGLGTGEVHRGDVVVVGEVPVSQVLDVVYRHLALAPMLPDETPVKVLHGTTEAVGNLHLAIDSDVVMPGDEVPAQLRLDGPLCALPGDRFVIRRVSPVETLGGGRIVDPWAPKMKTRDRVAHGEALLRLAKGDVGVWLERAGELGLEPESWRGQESLAKAVRLGDRLVHRQVVQRLDALLVEAMAAFHAAQPLALGANRHALRSGRLGHLSDKAFEALLARLTGLAQIEVQGPLVRIAGFAVKLTPAQEAQAGKLVEAVREAGLQGLTVAELGGLRPGPETPALIHLLETRGTLKSVEGLGLVAGDQLEGLVQLVKLWFSDHPELSAQDFKEITNLTRKAAIPLLEWLDQGRWTKRQPGSERVPGALMGAPTPAG